MEMDSAYHRPVLLETAIEGLKIDPDGVYVDATFGGGGHSREILARLKNGKLFGFDQDPDALANVPDDGRFTLIAQNFRLTTQYLRFYGIEQVDGILADLGVSSHQLDEAERGFSTRFDAPLDMRMDQQGKLTAADIVNTYEPADLIHLLREYGEINNAPKLVRKITEIREESPILRTGTLVKIATSFAPPRKERKYLAQIFQALRIEVNQEMEVLKEFLEQCVKALAPGGRLVVISYHSLEDRLVKRFLRSGNFAGEVLKDLYGNPKTPFKVISRKVIVPGEEEINENPRARSARMRIAERK
jgi:16S rRNA (cytosine1402-N4)-methyltransferase